MAEELSGPHQDEAWRPSGDYCPVKAHGRENHEGTRGGALLDGTGVIVPHQKLFGTAWRGAGALQVAGDRKGESGRAGAVTQGPPTRLAAAQQAVQGPAQPARLAGALAAGDVAARGTGAEAGTRVVCVPALPDLWDGASAEPMAVWKPEMDGTPPTSAPAPGLAALDSLSPSPAFLNLLASGLAAQPPTRASPPPPLPLHRL